MFLKKAAEYGFGFVDRHPHKAIQRRLPNELAGVGTAFQLHVQLRHAQLRKAESRIRAITFLLSTIAGTEVRPSDVLSFLLRRSTCGHGPRVLHVASRGIRGLAVYLFFPIVTARGTTASRPRRVAFVLCGVALPARQRAAEAPTCGRMGRKVSCRTEFLLDPKRTRNISEQRCY